MRVGWGGGGAPTAGAAATEGITPAAPRPHRAAAVQWALGVRAHTAAAAVRSGGNGPREPAGRRGGRPSASGRGLSLPAVPWQSAAAPPPGSRSLQRSFLTKNDYFFLNGLNSFFLSSPRARKRQKATPRIHSKRAAKGSCGSSQMLMFCFLT